MLEELKRHGYALSPGTLYPILHSMENRGCLQQETGVVDGRVRKYYTAMEVGRHALADVKGKMAELVNEILEGHGPGQLPDLSPDGR
jgi:PadR family transcriptional regulator PadR